MDIHLRNAYGMVDVDRMSHSTLRLIRCHHKHIVAQQPICRRRGLAGRHTTVLGLGAPAVQDAVGSRLAAAHKGRLQGGKGGRQQRSATVAAGSAAAAAVIGRRRPCHGTSRSCTAAGAAVDGRRARTLRLPPRCIAATARLTPSYNMQCVSTVP